MIFKTKTEKQKNIEKRIKHDTKKKWHLWFAWYPVRNHDTSCIIWFQKVWRKGEYVDNYAYYWSFEYRVNRPETEE